MLNPKPFIKRILSPGVLPPSYLGNGGQYMWILNKQDELLYAYDLSTAWPHTLVATVNISTMSAPGAIAFRPYNDSIYIVGSLEIGIVNNASNPAASTLTRVTGMNNFNFSSNMAGFVYDYRRDRFINLNGNGGQISIFNPKTNTELATTGWSEGFGSGPLYYAGDIEKLCINTSSFFGLYDTVATRSIFGRPGAGITAGAKDAVFYNNQLFIATLSAIVKATLSGDELRFNTTLATTQLTRAICADRVNNKLIVVCNNDGGGQNYNIKFINPETLVINSSLVKAVIADERNFISLKFANYNGKCYGVTVNGTLANPSRLFQIDGLTEAVTNEMNLPANMGTSWLSNNTLCFNRVEQ